MFAYTPKRITYLIMIKKFILFLVISFSLFCHAQYTDVINSNRPGFSESPFSVGSGVYQFETSVFFRKAKPITTFSVPQSLGLQLHFRTSFFDEKLELNLTSSLQRDKNAFKNVFTSSYNQLGLGELTLGAKYLVYKPEYTDKSKEIRSWKKRHGFDWKRWIPNVAVYAGVNGNLLLNDYQKHGGSVTPKAGVLLQNVFSDRYNLVTNVYYNHITSNYPELSYIVTATYNFNDYWSGFIEHQAIFNKYERQSNVGGGLAYLFNENMQINASLRATFQEETVGFFTGVGASYRINNHIDTFVELDEFGNKINNPETKSYNKGFFGRLLDKIKGIFKKKEKSTVEFKPNKKNPSDEKSTKEIAIDPEKRTRKKSVLDAIIKSDKKQKKEKLKETKRELKRKEKDKKRKEKEEKREQERKQKEKERAEKDREREQMKKLKRIKKMESIKRKEEMRRQKEEDKLDEELRKVEEELRKQKELEELEKKAFEKQKDTVKSVKEKQVSIKKSDSKNVKKISKPKEDTETLEDKKKKKN